MLLLPNTIRTIPAARVSGFHTRRAAAPPRASAQSSDAGVPLPQLDKDLENVLLSSPYDFFAFGPRVALAAALSIPETTQTIQQRVTRLQELVGDPRPLEAKAAEINQDVQSTLADYARRGRVLEEDIVRNVVSALPEEVRSFVPQPPPPAPTTTVVVEVEEEEEEVFDYSTFSASAMMEQQAVTELQDVQGAVQALQAALSSLAENKEPGREGMLKLNVREARDTLRGKLERLSPGLTASQDPTVAAAVQEAQELLGEVGATF